MINTAVSTCRLSTSSEKRSFIPKIFVVHLQIQGLSLPYPCHWGEFETRDSTCCSRSSLSPQNNGEESPETPLRARMEEQICLQSCAGSGISGTLPDSYLSAWALGA